jgi:xanthine dehydrogenase accessory factor
MDERLFGRLAARLADGPVVLATVVATRGATPRKSGSRMLIGARDTEFSVGGGAAEASVVEAARALLASPARAGSLVIDLTGRPGALGVCGGTMQVALRHWAGDEDRAYARDIATQLRAGRPVWAGEDELGPGVEAEALQPSPRLLIVGAGHCGAALHDLARHLDYDLWLFDPRAELLDPAQLPAATLRSGPFAALAEAFDTARQVQAVLLNRDYASDVATLRVLAGKPLAFLGMMGSRRRIGEVLAALDEPQRAALAELHAPVGLALGAQTPHEIAVSILAQLIEQRYRTAA